MKIAGIIAEYNPFHNGHRYHIQKTREAGATLVVAVMSPSVVQRGEAAVQASHDRAEAAIFGGADLVLELSPQWALSPARDFARAGVDVIARLGCADILSFGAETADVGLLSKALEATEKNELNIKKLMSGGLNYPQAAARACGEAAEIISGRNNILAMEYLRALKNSGIAPLAVQRTAQHDGAEPQGGFASASYIRSRIKAGGVEGYMGYSPDKSGLSFMKYGERAILWRLSMMSREDYENLPYSENIAGRLYEAARRANTLEEVYSAAKSRSVTHSRIRRAVMCAALGISRRDMFGQPFARVLALNARGAEVLKICRKTARIPLASSLAELSRLSPEAKRQAELIELASRLQSLCRLSTESITEYEKSARIIK